MRHSKETAALLQGDGRLCEKLRTPHVPLGCGVLADRAAEFRHSEGLGDHPAHVC